MKAKFFLFLVFFCQILLADEKVYKIKFSHVVSVQTPIGKAADYFAKRVFELSKGRLVVQVFPQSSLQDDSKILASLKLNNIQMAVPTLAKISTIFPEFGIFDLPFLFDDEKQVHKIADGKIGQRLKSLFQNSGVVAFDYWDTGFKHFSSSKKPILLPSDVVGQKFRIQSSKIIEEQMKYMGANAQVMPFSEVYAALSQGVIDASENPIVNFYNSKFYEVQSHLTLSSHAYSLCLVLVSKKFLDKLPEDLKEIFKQALSEATEFERAETKRQVSQIVANLKQYEERMKFKIYTLNSDEIAIWREKMVEIYPKFASIISPNLIKEVMEERDKNEK